MIYLDNSATTRPFPEVVRAVQTVLEDGYYNPSSAYGPAVEMERVVATYRSQLAQALGAGAGEIIYTSGATEANNIALLSVKSMRRGERGRLITTKVEHPSVFEVCQHLAGIGYDVVYLDVEENGSLCMNQLSSLLTPNTMMVSIMQVNNETGAINDIERINAMIRRQVPHAVFHVDGVQGFCKMPFTKLACDMYSISGHKFHATKGIGALYVRQGVPFGGGFIGGGQEGGLRSGTTNTPGIVGMGEALKVYRENQAGWLSSMRANKMRLAKNIGSIPDTVLNGPAADAGAPHILNASFLGVRGEVLLNALSRQGIFVSTGSACAAQKKGKNRVLCAMGIEGRRQEGAIRFSLCPQNTADEIDKASAVIADLVVQLRRFQKR